MKKVLSLFALLGAIALLQSCGGTERCPAYTEVSPQQTQVSNHHG